MNIFVLDNDPEIAARSLQDVHINKMLVESCQLLATAHPKGASPYSHTHFNHPCAKWVRESSANYEWLVCHALALSVERCHRWPERKEHASTDVAVWYASNVPSYQSHVLTNFALAMPEEFRIQSDPIASYRRYYATNKLFMKAHVATWSNRQPPQWLYDAVQTVDPRITITQAEQTYTITLA